jgi:hypothetical protein
MPVSEIAGEWAGEQPINHACAAAQRFLCRANQDKGETLLDRLQVDPQIEGTASGLANDWYLRPTIEKKAASVDGSIGTERETDLASEFARDISLHALSRIRTEADGGDNGEAAGLALSGREGLGAAPAERGDQPRNEPGRTNAGHGLPTRGRMRQGPGQGIELLRVQGILLLGLAGPMSRECGGTPGTDCSAGASRYTGTEPMPCREEPPTM